MAPFLTRLGNGGGIPAGFGFGRRRSVGASGPFSATGGTTTAAGITPGNGYRYHVFTSPGTFSVSGSPKNVEYLVVAGGGGGGNGQYGGGGAGGLRHNVTPDPRAGSTFTANPGNYSVTVGNGGSGDGYDASPPGHGSPSSFGPISTSGGGAGGTSPFDGGSPTNPAQRAGGSGGGGQYGPTGANPFAVGGTGNTGGYSPVEGFPGGNGGPDGSPGGGYPGGGGGGAGAVGSNGSINTAGSGGAGYPIPAFAAPLISPEIPAPTRTAWSNAVGPTGLYAGGGGGGGYGAMSGGPAAGGPGGGGAGAAPGGNDGTPGVLFTGGGGGSSTSSQPQDGQIRTEGSGGTGIVIIRYLV